MRKKKKARQRQKRSARQWRQSEIIIGEIVSAAAEQRQRRKISMAAYQHGGIKRARNKCNGASARKRQRIL